MEVTRPSGLMDKASASEAGDCGFKSHLGRGKKPWWTFKAKILSSKKCTQLDISLMSVGRAMSDRLVLQIQAVKRKKMPDCTVNACKLATEIVSQILMLQFLQLHITNYSGVCYGPYMKPCILTLALVYPHIPMLSTLLITKRKVCVLSTLRHTFLCTAMPQ